MYETSPPTISASGRGRSHDLRREGSHGNPHPTARIHIHTGRRSSCVAARGARAAAGDAGDRIPGTLTSPQRYGQPLPAFVKGWANRLCWWPTWPIEDRWTEGRYDRLVHRVPERQPRPVHRPSWSWIAASSGCGRARQRTGGTMTIAKRLPELTWRQAIRSGRVSHQPLKVGRSWQCCGRRHLTSEGSPGR